MSQKRVPARWGDTAPTTAPPPRLLVATLLVATIVLAACAPGPREVQEATRSIPPASVARTTLADPPTAEPSPASSPTALPGPTPMRTPAPTPAPAPARSLAPGPVRGWLLVATTVRAIASSGAQAQIRLGANFPIMVLPETMSVGGVAWRRVTPLTVARARTGWVPASTVTLVRPSGGTSATFDALDPALAAYLAKHGTQVGSTVLDLTHGVTYQYNSGHAFITGSSVKVPIMLALLRELEAAGRRPTQSQVALLTAMIEHSDNKAATNLDLQVGDRAGLRRFASTFGLTGFSPGSHYDDGWGWGTITPDAMVRLLTLFQRGKVLASAADTRLARLLMSHVEADQRFGVGTTAPAGATVLMKNGWVPGPDGLWVANSSGIVITAHDTYVVAVFTAHDASLGEGRAILEHVCAAVAARLK